MNKATEVGLLVILSPILAVMWVIKKVIYLIRGKELIDIPERDFKDESIKVPLSEYKLVRDKLKVERELNEHLKKKLKAKHD